MLKILHAGDVVGSPGRTVFARVVTRMRDAGQVDLVVVNAENAAGGRGLTPSLAEELLAAGADAITLGDHTWDQKELAPYLPQEPRIVRPGNFAPACPGKGITTVKSPKGPVTVISVIGRVFMQPNDCPFRTADRLVSEAGPGRIILVEIHAEATSEKIAMGRFLDGRVTSVVGTHTHVQTSDETLLPRGTAYITDLGMTGPRDSVLGRDVEAVVKRFTDGMPGRFGVATENVALEGVLLHIDESSGRAIKIQRVREAG
jgi:metallophosphoesterase (TIGR00282 family)